MKLGEPLSYVRHLSLTFAYDEQRILTIFFPPDATHIFDGLNAFPTHVAHMSFGTLVTPPRAWPFTAPSVSSDLIPSQPLYSVALQWLKEDREKRRELERQGKKTRGARRDTVGDNEALINLFGCLHVLHIF